MRVLLLATALLIARPAPPAHAAPRWVEIAPIEGLRADAIARASFLEAFQAAFDQGRLATQERGPGGWSPGDPLPNRFMRIEPGAGRQAWTLEVVVGLPPLRRFQRTELTSDQNGQPQMQLVWKADPRRRSARGINVSILIQSADEVLNEVGPTPWQTGVTFPPPPAPEGADLTLSLRGYPFPWADAGRSVGLLALEALHRRSRDLPENQRLDLASAVRAEPQP